MMGRSVSIGADRRRREGRRNDDQARTGLPGDLVGLDLDAMRAGQNRRLQPTSGVAIEEGDGVAFLKRRLGPDLLPLTLHDGDAEHVQAHFRQAVFRSCARFDLRLGQKAGGHQLLQAVGQHAARRAQAITPHAEPAHAVEGLAHDQLGPGVAGDGEGARHGIAHDQGADVELGQIRNWLDSGWALGACLGSAACACVGRPIGRRRDSQTCLWSCRLKATG